MTGRRALFMALAAAPAALCYALTGLTAGCFPTDCVARGGGTTYEGSASYSGQTTHPLSGSVATSVTVSDLNDNCTYDSMEFTVAIGSCTVWAQLETVSTDDGGSDAGTTTTASIEPGQSCSLPLAGGEAAITITSGSLTIDTNIMLALTGNVVVSQDGSVADGVLQWSYNGD